jgi:hypothetical protein
MATEALPLSHFMGYKVIHNPMSMEHMIIGPNGETVKFERHRMEEDKVYMQSIVDAVTSWNVGEPGYITNGVVTRSKPDFRDVSTSDLLNEAFRRGAIKQLTMKRAVSKYQIDEYGDDFMKHVHTKLRYDALASSADELEKAGVFNVGKREGGLHPYDDVEFSIDYFICKHPLTLKREEGRAD